MTHRAECNVTMGFKKPCNCGGVPDVRVPDVCPRCTAMDKTMAYKSAHGNDIHCTVCAAFIRRAA